MKTPASKILAAVGAVLIAGTGAVATVWVAVGSSVPPEAAAAPQVAAALATPGPEAATTPEPTPTPTPAPSATPAATPAPTPVTIARGTIVAAAVKPAVRAGVPIICQSQAYSVEREQQCPHAAPTKQVTLEEINLAAAPSPTPAPVATPVPTPTSAPVYVPEIAPPPAPTATPAPATPAPAATPPVSPACGGGYPASLCNAPIDTVVDPWGMYNRECTSYAAYKVSASGRKMPYWGGRGNAIQWPANARAAGIAVDGTPRAGDVAISSANSWGHAMYVESVLPDGKIYVSQFNYGAIPGTYSTMIVPAAGLQFIHF